MINKVQITGSEENMDNGFYSLMNQSTSFHCLRNEVYIVSDEAIKKLKEDEIEFIKLAYGNKIKQDTELAKSVTEDKNERNKI